MSLPQRQQILHRPGRLFGKRTIDDSLQATIPGKIRMSSMCIYFGWDTSSPVSDGFQTAIQPRLPTKGRHAFDIVLLAGPAAFTSLLANAFTPSLSKIFSSVRRLDNFIVGLHVLTFRHRSQLNSVRLRSSSGTRRLLLCGSMAAWIERLQTFGSTCPCGEASPRRKHGIGDGKERKMRGCG